MSDGPNLFARLHKWAARQDENFLTESLAVVLEDLLILAPEVGVRLVSRLTSGFIDLNPDEASTIEVRTQIEAGSGRPDLEFRTRSRLVWVEVKVESELRTGQLEGYRVLLRESGLEETRLVLLTRYPEVFQADETRPDVEVRWFELTDWMESELRAVEAANAAAGFLLQQLPGFLRGRNMNLTQVGKYMPEGIRALANMLNMLFEAAMACKVSVTKSTGWDHIGITLDRKYWVGIEYAEPEKLRFIIWSRINPDAAGTLGLGEMKRVSWAPPPPRWVRDVELDSEPVHFFSRSKVDQIRWLEVFLRECLTMARSIETPDQPPIPEEPDES